MRAVRARVLTTVLTLGALALGVAACGGGAESSPGGGSAEAASADGAPTTIPLDARVARATGPEVAVFADPGTSDEVQRVPGTSAFGFRQSFLVLEDREESLEVLLPVRPNGSTGWVRRADVDLQPVAHEVEVDLGTRTLALRVDGDLVLETTVGVGAPDVPTPTGRFFVTDLLETGDPNHTYGPYAIGLSGFSDVLTEFAGGDGQIGIHGTNDPASIGHAVSHGCVRVANDVIEILATTVPVGTPVTIR